MTTTFREKLNDFVRRQRIESPHDAQQNAHDLSQQVQEYAPKERWGNIFKYVVAYALGIGLGHALAAALTRGADELAKPSGMDPDALASSIESGDIDNSNFNEFMGEIGVEDPNFRDFEADMAGFQDPTDPAPVTQTENVDGADPEVADTSSDIAGTEVPTDSLGDTLSNILES